MLKKEWVAVHNGCKILATSTWTGGAKLYIDGDCRDTNNDLVASADSPSLSALITPANVLFRTVYFAVLCHLLAALGHKHILMRMHCPASRTKWPKVA
jgi:hypothetical protein